ncbi:MAG TPA: ATP synthase F1 subunit delta [Thermoanaerobaculia bacterium]|nr:ATP synthase F1 subunit delta [Thermoanaerobaculia bacterium]
MSASFAHPYARAFLEAAPSGYDVGAFLKAGQTMSDTFAANPQLRAFLLAPNVPREVKSKTIAALAAKAGLDEYGARFLQVMLKNHRLLEAAEVFKTLRDLYDARQNVLRVQLTVAASLSDAERQSVEAAIAARTGMTVRSQVEIDPTLLGGFIARAGSRVFDATVAAALRRFQSQVKERTGA